MALNEIIDRYSRLMKTGEGCKNDRLNLWDAYLNFQQMLENSDIYSEGEMLITAEGICREYKLDRSKFDHNYRVFLSGQIEFGEELMREY